MFQNRHRYIHIYTYSYHNVRPDIYMYLQIYIYIHMYTYIYIHKSHTYMPNYGYTYHIQDATYTFIYICVAQHDLNFQQLLDTQPLQKAGVAAQSSSCKAVQGRVMPLQSSGALSARATCSGFAEALDSQQNVCRSCSSQLSDLRWVAHRRTRRLSAPCRPNL